MLHDVPSSIEVLVPLPFISRTVNLTYLSSYGYRHIFSKGLMGASPVTARSTLVSWGSLPLLTPTEYFYLQKSGNPTSGWVTIKRLTTIDKEYLDLDANNTMNRHDVEYYRILAPESLIYIGDCKTEGYIDPYGAEMARRHHIQLRHGNQGNKTYVFTKMRNGIRCTECWDEVLHKRSRVNCVSCNSTGYAVGFYNPIETYINFGPESVAISQDVDGPNPVNNAVQCWTANYPLLNIGDVVLEPGSNRFWSVNRTNITMHKRVVTKQEFQLDREDGDDPLLSLINRVPKEVAPNGESVFTDDAENSEGVCYHSTTEVLYKPRGVPVDF